MTVVALFCRERGKGGGRNSIGQYSKQQTEAAGGRQASARGRWLQQQQQAMQHQQQVQEVDSEEPTPQQQDPQDLWPGDVDTLMQDFDMTEWEPYFTQANFEDFSNPNF